MVAPHARNLLIHKHSVSRDFLPYFFSVNLKNPPDAIARFCLPGSPQFARQKSLSAPGSPPEDARGIGGGCHGGDLLIIFGNLNILCLIQRKQRGSGGADDIGARGSRQKGEMRFVEAIVVAGAFVPATARQKIRLQGGFQAAHGI